jgi:UDP-glucose 4-epimerase
MNSFIKNQPIQISKGEQQLDYTYVGDIVNAYVKTIEHLTGSDKKTHNVFNIGTGKPVSIRTIVSILEKSSGYPSPVTYGDGYAENEIMYMNCNNSKAKLVLNWEPKYTIETGLKKVYTYYKSHPNEL